MKWLKSWWMDLSILEREHIVSTIQMVLISIATIGMIIGFIIYLSQWHSECELPMLVVSLISYVLAYALQFFEGHIDMVSKEMGQVKKTILTLIPVCVVVGSIVLGLNMIARELFKLDAFISAVVDTLGVGLLVGGYLLAIWYEMLIHEWK